MVVEVVPLAPVAEALIILLPFITQHQDNFKLMVVFEAVTSNNYTMKYIKRTQPLQTPTANNTIEELRA
jgi:hypothetical protein